MRAPVGFFLLILLAACGDGNDAGAAREAGLPDSSNDGAMDAARTPEGGAEGGMDSAVDGVDASLTPVAQSEFAARLSVAYCAAVRPCCDKHSTYKDSCVADAEAAIVDVLTRTTPDAAYSATFAAQCVQALEDLPRDCHASYESRRSFLVPCQQVINGTKMAGELCGEGLKECAVPLGYSNNRDVGFVGCSLFDDGMQRCRHFAAAQDGEPCIETTGGGNEAVSPQCTYGLFCDAGTCKRFPSAGNACGAGRGCYESYCDAAEMCQPFVSAGEACVSFFSCDECGGQAPCTARYQCDEGETNVCAPDNVVRFFGMSFGLVASIAPSLACD